MDITSIVAQLKEERDRLDQAITALEGSSTTARRGRPPKPSQPAGRRGARHMSAAARARIAAAKKAWWAKQKGQAVAKPTGTAKRKAGGRRHMSPAARKRLSALMKARWAARKRR